MRGVTAQLVFTAYTSGFQLTRLMRGVTRRPTSEGGRTGRFQLTRLMRGVTLFLLFGSITWIFQLTRLMRGVTIR